MNHLLRHAVCACITVTTAATAVAQDKPVWQPLPKESMPAPQQRPAPAPASSSATAAKGAPATAMLHAPPRLDPDRVWFDVPSADGTLWVGSLRYKARFGASDVTFVPSFGSRAPRNFPVAFEFETARCGAAELAVGVATPTTDGRRTVDLDRGDVLERYHVDARGIEQTFVFPALPARDDVTVTVRVATELAAAEHAGGGGLRFANEHGHVDYGRAIAFDATGRTFDVATTFTDGLITHRVAATAVADAVLPLTIDPVVTSFSASQFAFDQNLPDIAWSPATEQYLVVWTHVHSLTDGDTFAELRDASGALVANSQQWIDRTTDNWRNPKVAYHAAAARHLVVAEVNAPGQSERAVRGRWRDAALPVTMGAQFTISGLLPGDKISPDVGGDGNLQPPTYWTVVWERRYSATDSDIHFRQIEADGALRGAGTQYLENSTALDRRPRISKSCGAENAPSQDWAVVWEREFSATDHDVHGARVHWDGAVTQPAYGIETSRHDDLRPSVSSTTDTIDFSRYHLVAFQRDLGQFDVCTALLKDGAPIAFENLSQLENVAPNEHQVVPSVDSDGCRFAVAYAERYSLGSNDYDVHVATLQLVGRGTPTLGLLEGHQVLGNTSQWEGQVEIASLRSSGGGSGRYAAVWNRDTPGTNARVVDGAIYDGEGSGGFQIVNTGCSGLNFTVTGSPRLGDTVRLRLAGLTGPSGFLVGLPRPPLPVCAGCSLGVQGDTFAQGILDIEIPCDGSLVGVTAAAQPYDLFGGQCFGTIRLGDTVLMTVY